MALQVLVYNKKTGENSIERYCSGECFLEHWAAETAEPCEVGEFACEYCKRPFVVESVAKTSKYLNVDHDGGGWLLPVSNLDELFAEMRGDIFEVGSRYVIEVVELPDEVVDALSEFDGF